jgi:hypothetical protein
MKRYAHDAVRLRRVGGADEEEGLSVPDSLDQIRSILSRCIDGNALSVAIVDELANTDIIGGDPDNPPETATDKRRRRLGMDSRRRQPSAAEERAFLGRFGNAGRIQVM